LSGSPARTYAADKGFYKRSRIAISLFEFNYHTLYKNKDAVTAKKKHIAIAVQNGIGDVIMSLPMLSKLDNCLPTNSVLSLLLMNRKLSGLLKLLQWKSTLNIFPLDYRGGWNYQKLLSIAFQLRYAHPDVYLAVHSTNRLLPAFFAKLVGAPISVGPDGRWSKIGFNITIPSPGDKHKVHYYAEFLKAAGLSECELGEVEVILPPDKMVEAQHFLKNDDPSQKWIFLAPGSGPKEAHKRWPEERYKELILCLLRHSKSFHVGLFGGPDDRDSLERISGAAIDFKGRCVIMSQGDFAMSLALLRQADCLVSGCSGPAHLATLAKIPIVALYGPTNYCSTGPYSSHVRIVRKALKCSPCYRVGFRQGCKTPMCMKAISVDDVFDAVLRTLNGEPFPTWPPLQTTNAVACSMGSDILSDG
jgi:ADP-heptose:LPS heptosyltransferase